MTAALLLAGAAAIWPLISERYASLLLVVTPTAIVTAILSLHLFVLRAQNRSGAYSIVVTINTLLRYVPAILVMYVFGPNIYTFVAMWGASQAIGAIALIAFILRGTRPTLGAVNWTTLSNFARYGIPIMVTATIAAFSLSADRFILHSLGGPAELAVYGICLQLGYAPLIIVSRSVLLAVLPIALEDHEHGRNPQPRITSGLRYLLIIIGGPTAILAVVSVPLVIFYASVDYEAAGRAIPLMLIATLMQCITQFFRTPFLVAQRTSSLVPIESIALATAVVTALILVPVVGLYGAVYAMIARNIVLLSLTFFKSRSLMKLRFPLRTGLNVAIAMTAASGSAWLVLYSLPNSLTGLGLAVAAGGTAYVLTIMASGELRHEVGQLLRSRQARRRVDH